MSAWTKDELDKIGKAEELQISSLRSDGTLRGPTTIWVVRVGDDLYVRPVRGRAAAWFRGTQVRQEGRIRAGGVDKAVSFVDEADPGTNNQVDAEYRSKYRRHAAQFVNSVLTPQSRAATLKLLAR